MPAVDRAQSSMHAQSAQDVLALQYEAIVACLLAQLHAPLDSSSALRYCDREVFAITMCLYFSVQHEVATVVYKNLHEGHEVKRLCREIAAREEATAEHFRRQNARFAYVLAHAAPRPARPVRALAVPSAPLLKTIPLPDLPDSPYATYPQDAHWAPPTPASSSARASHAQKSAATALGKSFDALSLFDA